MLSEQEYNEKMLGQIAKLSESAADFLYQLEQLLLAIHNRQRLLNLPSAEQVAEKLREKGFKDLKYNTALDNHTDDNDVDEH